MMTKAVATIALSTLMMSCSQHSSSGGKSSSKKKNTPTQQKTTEVNQKNRIGDLEQNIEDLQLVATVESIKEALMNAEVIEQKEDFSFQYANEIDELNSVHRKQVRAFKKAKRKKERLEKRLGKKNAKIEDENGKEHDLLSEELPLDKESKDALKQVMKIDENTISALEEKGERIPKYINLEESTQKSALTGLFLEAQSQMLDSAADLLAIDAQTEAINNEIEDVNTVIADLKEKRKEIQKNRKAIKKAKFHIVNSEDDLLIASSSESPEVSKLLSEADQALGRIKELISNAKILRKQLRRARQ